MHPIRIQSLIGLAALVALGGCDKLVEPAGDAPVVVASLAISPSSVRMGPGDTAFVTVVARDSAGAEVESATVVWDSRDVVLANASGRGTIIAGTLMGAISADTTWIVAIAGPARDSVRVIVSTVVAAGAPRMGINLAMINDWSTEWPFQNVFYSSRYWISQRNGAGWGEGGPLALTSEYWISSLEAGQFATTIMLNDATGHQQAGDYVLLYDGDGDIGFETNSSITVVTRTPGRIVVRVPAGTGGGVFMTLRRTNPSNPVRNVRFIRPGAEATYATQPFTDDFLRVVRPFGVLRFMQWQWTDDNPVNEWSRRATPSFATYAGPWGVAAETMIALANETGADPWFCMPHNASDDYVRQFATLVRSQLGARQRVYVEYSNEVWNSIFPQANYVRERGQALNLSSDSFQGGLRYYAQRSVEIFNIWREAFGGDSARVVRVLASQAANSWTAEQVLSWRDAYRSADAIAIAPYFGGALSGGDGSAQAAMSETQLLDALSNDLEGPVRAFIEDNARIARTYGVRMVAYEGGQHLVSAYVSQANEPAVTQLFMAVNRHPRMGDLYRRYFDLWFGAGGDLFIPYDDADVWSRYGSWGALEYIHQPPATSPKYQAILDAVARYGSLRR